MNNTPEVVLDDKIFKQISTALNLLHEENKHFMLSKNDMEEMIDEMFGPGYYLAYKSLEELKFQQFRIQQKQKIIDNVKKKLQLE